MDRSPSLEKFQAVCHEYYTCFVLSAEGMRSFVQGLPIDPVKYPDQKFFIGNTPPEEGAAQSVMSAAQAHSSAQKNGTFPDIIAKALIIRLYAEWDERYRHEIAKEFGVNAKKVLCDLMGDVRRVRNWIVHSKSVIQNDAEKIVVLPWSVTPKKELRVSVEMLQQLMDSINNMPVKIST